ncbi:GNAT family N-acetyltransferase [Streptomyces sp. NPDC059340]|uniref:GNAT family N-acetyltransferase n=1 Tax=Streptomyces sp. NPDC059340 TaxID=3346806 RepID=UPI00369CF8FE
MKSALTEYLRPAAAADVPALLALRTEAEGWLRDKGTDQWSDPETGERAIAKWRASIDEGRAWVVIGEDDEVLATVSRGPVDRDFWTDADHPESALYLYKLIVAREASGRQLGTRVIDWMSRLAALEGRAWVRIDTWRTNSGLHSYYKRLGFRHVRTEAPPHRRSGWLAQRPAGALAMPHDLLPVHSYEEQRVASTHAPELPPQRDYRADGRVAPPSQFPSHSPSSDDVHSGSRDGRECEDEQG